MNGLVFGYAMDIMQIIRKNRLRRWMRIGIWTGIFVLMAINKVLMNASEESVALGNIGFIIATVYNKGFLQLCLIFPSMAYYTEIMQYGGKRQYGAGTSAERTL